jgi:hypothetical protein
MEINGKEKLLAKFNPLVLLEPPSNSVPCLDETDDALLLEVEIYE